MELKDRLKYARKRANLTQSELADRAGIKQASVSEIERGLSRTSGHLVRIATICDVDPLWLAEGIGEPPEGIEAESESSTVSTSSADQVRAMLAKIGSGLSDTARKKILAAVEETRSEAEVIAIHTGNVITADLSRPELVGDEVWIAHYDVRAAMGGGQIAHDHPEMLKDIRISPSHLRSLGLEFEEHYHLKVVTGWGQSMAPTIKHGDPLIVDIHVREFVGDGVYFFAWDGHVYVKRLQIADEDHYEMISDNPKHKDRLIRRDMTYIQARVLLVWNSQLL
ncbi:XRE family transcriptional regulator [Pseudomonas abietaniphila]|uniref:XRE family transcriptional regulator n=1 Tax=Pseudomonas abietaniphila TaxID=89065 RepID=UPI000783E85B|nr:S24 family peptidase [Pseudomonas abietaniphila]